MEGIENPRSGTEDISEDFLNLSPSDFTQLLRKLRNKAELIVVADLSFITDQNEFKTKARLAKAFLESSPSYQIRKVSLKATPEQVKWEPNVFSSGVELLPV